MATLTILGEIVSTRVGEYVHGGTALQLACVDGEPFATVSVWVPESLALPRDVVYVKHWGENASLILPLVAAGILTPALEFARAGCGAQAYRIAAACMPPA